MATQTSDKPEQKGTYLTKENWEVMKPFVHFGLKAMALIGTALFAIVKLAVKSAPSKSAEDEYKNGKIIKI